MLKEVFSAGIIGIGLNMPKEVRVNSYWDNIELVNSPKEKSCMFKGIEERRIFPDDILPSDAETIAAKRAIEDSGIDPQDIDLVMVHSMLQDKIIPGNASLVQHKLGLKNAGAWNLDTCCSSFVNMITTASHLIMMGTCKNIVIASSVFHSRMVPTTHYLSPTAGDGAAAIVMGRVSEGRGYQSTYFHSKGELHDAFTVREGCVVDENGPKPILQFTINSDGVKKVGKNSLDDMTNMIHKALNIADVKVDEIDFMITHQPAYWTHSAWRDGIGVPAEKSYESFYKYGNLASTSIPVNIFEARALGKLKDDDMILLASSGAGENFAISLLKWGK